MAKFTKADEIDVPQSVGHYTDGNPDGSEELYVFQPHQGRDLLYKNPKLNNGSTKIEEDHDKRISLGTYTLNNRDYWENNNFNESTLQPYLKDNLETHDTIIVETSDGPIVRTTNDNVYDNPYQPYLWSIDALPFVVNPNTDDIIHLDRYYDKEIHKEQYELATEGKINYYLEPRYSGRGAYRNNATDDNIDIFSNRGKRTKGGGQNYFDWLIKTSINDDSDTNDENGFYLFKLNWGDGSEIEYTSKPQLLESTTLLEHFYDNPGFYTISGLVYQLGTNLIRAWEKFETNILLNPSPDYKLKLFDYNNFASIGGINKDSAFVKSLYDMVGINPLPPYENNRASEKVIEKLNTLDKIQLLNVLGKVDYLAIQPYNNFLSPYQTPTDDIEHFIFGCIDVNAANYNQDANWEDGSCVYIHNVNIIVNTNDREIPVPAGAPMEFEIVHNGETESIEVGENEINRGTNTFKMISSLETLGDYDWNWLGWYNGDELLTANVEYTTEVLSNDLNLTANFQYIDDTPPLPIRHNLPANQYHNYHLMYNYEEFYNPNYSNQTTIPYDSLVILFDDPAVSTYDDIDYFKIDRIYYDYIQEETIEVEIAQIPFDTEKVVQRMPNNLNFSRYKYIDENLPYRDYGYRITTVDTSGLESEPVESDTYISRKFPTPSDQEPDPLDSNLQSIEQIKNNQIQYTWQEISEAWPGLEGNFKHFKIEIDGPDIFANSNGDYVINHSGSYNTVEPESEDNRIPAALTFPQDGGLVYKTWSQLGSLVTLPWTFKASVVATSLGSSEVEQESAATEPIEIYPENFLAATVQIGGQGGALHYFELETGYFFLDPEYSQNQIYLSNITNTFDYESGDYAQFQDILSIAQEGDKIELTGMENNDDNTYTIQSINPTSGYIRFSSYLFNEPITRYLDGTPYTGEFKLLRPYTTARSPGSDISLSSYMDEDGDSHIPVPIRYWTYDLFDEVGTQDHNLFIRAFIKGDESTVDWPGITFYGDQYNRIHLGDRYYINPGVNQHIDDYVIDLPNDIPVGTNIFIGVYDANDTNLLLDTSEEYSETQPFQIQEVYGCTDVNSDNHEPQATVDFNCRYSFIIETESITEDTDYEGTIHAHRIEFNLNDDDTVDFNRATLGDQLDGEGTYDNEPTIDYDNFETEIEFVIIYIDNQGGSDGGGGEFKRWEIDDGLEFTDDVYWEGNELVFGNTQTWTENVDDLNFSLRGHSLAVRPAPDENGNNVAGPNNFEDKVIRVVWAQEGIEYEPTIALGQLGQDLNLPVYAPVDIDDNEYGTDDYPMDPQPVQVQGAPLFEDYPYENQSPYGAVGPTSFTLMDNAVIYDEPGSLWEGSEIDLWTRIIEVQVVEPFEQDGVTYTQSLEHWEIKQGLEYIHKIYDANDDRIFNWQVGGSREGFIYAMDQENPEDIHSIKIEYSTHPDDDFNSDVPIIIEAFFSQVDEDGEESGGGKYPGGG